MKLVILDRDGTINEDSDHYIKSPEELHLIEGSLDAIARLTQAGYRIVVATNQSGIARGLFDLLTVYSVETNTAADGQRRIEIDDNDRDMRRTLQARLRARLDQKRADEILIAIGTSDMRDIFEFYDRAKRSAKMTARR